MDYLLLKNTHAGLAIVSVVLFLLRAGMVINHGGKPSLTFKILAHGIDTALLILGAMLAYTLSLNPFLVPWFGVKLLAIVLYITLGVVVMRNKNKKVKEIALVLSLLVVTYIFILAINKSLFDLRVL